MRSLLSMHTSAFPVGVYLGGFGIMDFSERSIHCDDWPIPLGNVPMAYMSVYFF